MHYLESGNEMPRPGLDAESPDCCSPGAPPRPAPPRHKVETLEQHLDI